jgi:hypothetical protein
MTTGRLPSVEGGIQPTIIDAKGDLIAGVSNDTPARLGVGTDGSVLQADSTAATGLSWAGPLFAAGKNKIINGDFGVWQRGTSFSNPVNETYLADRFNIVFDGTGATRTVSQQAFTPGTAPVSGYESAYFIRMAQTVAGSGGTYIGFNQRIEDVRTYAGQTITLSFWAKADASRTILPNFQQNFGTGGSTTVSTSGTTITLTTSWARYTQNFTLPSITGKTIGTSSMLQLFLGFAANTVQTIDIWGVQVEAGSVATAFQTATGTVQGELAACQRYYYRITGPAQSGSNFGIGTYGSAATTGYVGVTVPAPSTLRTYPSSIDYSSGLIVSPDEITSSISVTAVALEGFSNSNNLSLLLTLTGATQYRPYRLYGGASSYVGFSAEL